MKYASSHAFMEHVALRNPGQPEFLQAVTEVMESLGRSSARTPSTPSKAFWTVSWNLNA